MRLVTSTQMRAIEERAVKALGIPSILLMENAAQQTVKHIMALLESKSDPKVVVVCGPGNNGGDGFAIARLLHVKGIKVQAVLAGDNVKGDALTNLQIAKKMGLLSEAPLNALLPSADLIVDALFGTGLKGAIAGELVDVIEAINGQSAVVVSVDIPSGVEADTGKVGSVAVRAHTTVAYGLAKVGHILFPGTEYAGHVVVEDISIPSPQDMLVSGDVHLEILEDITNVLPARHARSNKGTHGRVCVLAGCNDMPGAAVLCCKAAYKAGAGLVHACVVPEVARVIQTSSPEVITTIAADKNGHYVSRNLSQLVTDSNQLDALYQAIKNASVVALGPGIGRNPAVQAFVRDVLVHCDKPMVIDADALMAIAADKSILENKKAPCVITPHPGEMAALTGLSIQAVLEDIVGCAKAFAQEYGVVTLLKDARTIIAAPDGRTFINPTGTPALAKAGSGDVLTGVIAAFIAQGLDIFMAAVAGAYVHGRAGQLAAKDLSVYGVAAGDVAEYVGRVMEMC
ncbi:MAG: NAD(P)H-hydrate dehydratase [Defluviitaleaceae bacterium]|nr:NAD(P)H-hydrate dehydratase [Defluviitaleaceae bacterium]